MKRITFLVLLALTLLLTSCSFTVGDGTANTTATPSQTQIPTDSHDYEATVTPPTCEDEGYTTYTCAHCGDSYVADKVPALGHTEEATPGRDATCTAEGVVDGVVCSVCDKVLSAQTVIPAKGHDYKAVITAPTCEDKGYTTYTCATCNDSYKADETAALGHTRQTVVGNDATCTSTGLTDGVVCSVCDKVLIAQAVIPAKGHDYESVVTAPTCQDAGYTTNTCSVCGDAYVTNYVSAKGHSYGASVTAPTCEAAGFTTYTCSVCADSYTGNQVAATGHSWVDATYEAPKTCRTCGKTEGDTLPGPLPDDSGNTSGGFDKTLYVNYIDVGQGDSIFLKVGDCDILIDGGKSGSASTVVNYLKGKGVDDIELMINSHPDNDHYGGLPTVLNNFKVEELWISPFAKTTSTYTSFKNTASSKGLTAKTPSVGTTYTYENLKLTVIYNGSDASNSNDSSIVVKVEYGDFNFLFTGDISSTVENKLLSKDIQCDVLKVAHHGSAGSSSSAFLSATGAKYGVISVGAGNSYGHPTSAALGRLSSAGISVYRTDQDGTVVFSTNGTTLYLPGSGSVSGGSDSGSSDGSGDSGSSGGSDSTQYFIGNTETKKFHLPTCSYLPAASKQNVMYDYWWIINIAGYSPCGHCLKNYVP